MKYTRFLVGFLALLCVMSFQVVPQVQAKPMGSPYCGLTQCNAYQFLSAGDNHGLASTWSDPTVTTVQSGNDITIDIGELNASGTNEIDIGMEFVGNSVLNNDFCTVNGSGSYYFYHYSGGTACYAIPSGDHGHPVTFKMGYYTSNGGGMFFQVTGNTGETFCTATNACFVSGLPQVWKGEEFYEDSQLGYENSWTSTQYGIHHLTDNQYQQDVTGSPWQYQHSDFAAGTEREPSYSNWLVTPSNSSTGGDMFMCMEASNLPAC